MLGVKHKGGCMESGVFAEGTRATSAAPVTLHWTLVKCQRDLPHRIARLTREEGSWQAIGVIGFIGGTEIFL